MSLTLTINSRYIGNLLSLQRIAREQDGVSLTLDGVMNELILFSKIESENAENLFNWFLQTFHKSDELLNNTVTFNLAREADLILNKSYTTINRCLNYNYFYCECKKDAIITYLLTMPVIIKYESRNQF